MPDCRLHQEFEHHLLLATPDEKQLFEVPKDASYEDDGKTRYLTEDAPVKHVITPAAKAQAEPEMVSVPAAVLDRVAQFGESHQAK